MTEAEEWEYKKKAVDAFLGDLSHAQINEIIQMALDEIESRKKTREWLENRKFSQWLKGEFSNE
jgi:hypothetical protein